MAANSGAKNVRKVYVVQVTGKNGRKLIFFLKIFVISPKETP